MILVVILVNKYCNKKIEFVVQAGIGSDSFFGNR